MGRIGPRQQRFEVLPEPDWGIADVLTARELSTTPRRDADQRDVSATVEHSAAGTPDRS